MSQAHLSKGSTAEIVALLKYIEKRDDKKGTYGKVNITAPKNGQGWKFRASVNGVPVERKRGKTLEHAVDGLVEAYKEVAAKQAQTAADTTKTMTSVPDALAAYIESGGRSGTWSESNTVEVSQILNFWSVNENLKCYQLNKSHVRKFYSQTNSRNTREKRANKFRTFVRWMQAQEYVTDLQATELLNVDKNIDVKTKAALSRAERLKQPDTAAELGPIMTHEQVNAFATATRPATMTQKIQRANGRDYEREIKVGYEHGELLIQLLAVTGLRIGEALLLAANTVKNRENKNVNKIIMSGGRIGLDENQLDRLDGRMKIEVKVQARPKKPDEAILPKGGKTRNVFIAGNDRVSTGYDLTRNLVQRALEAREEQEAGINPKALLFPSPQMNVWTQSNLTSRYIGPAADSLGWDLTKDTDLQKHHAYTLHSLRDRFATTAVNEWGLNPAELTQMGGWSDIAVVFRHYYGATAETEQNIYQKMTGRTQTPEEEKVQRQDILEEAARRTNESIYEALLAKAEARKGRQGNE